MTAEMAVLTPKVVNFLANRWKKAVSAALGCGRGFSRGWQLPGNRLRPLAPVVRRRGSERLVLYWATKRRSERPTKNLSQGIALPVLSVILPRMDIPTQTARFWDKPGPSKFLIISTRTLDAWMRARRVPYFKVPTGSVRFRRSKGIR